MNKYLSRIFSVAVILALALSLLSMAQSARASGTVSLTTFGSAYTEDFNTLAITGTSSSVPNGWDFSESGTSGNLLYTAGTGSSTTGDTYSFGTAGSSERAFGGLLSGSLTPLIGAQFTNNTGETITSLDITYTGEQWRAGVTNRNAADRLDFQLSTNATSLNTGTWVDYDNLDFNSPAINSTIGALDGNALGNHTTLSFTITGLVITSGSNFWIRWSDFNISSSDDGLSVDDFSLTSNGFIPATPSLTVNDVSANEGNSGSTTFTFTVNLDSPAGAGGVSFDIATADNIAISPDDFTTKSLTGQTIPAGNSTYTFDVLINGDTTDEPDETFFVNISNVTGANLLDGQGQGTIVNDDINFCTQPYTPIYDIQGSGATVALPGAQTTQGVVVGDYEGASPALRGFFIQDPVGDGNAATSDGIFVFEGSNLNTVNVGDVVRVTGNAGENQGQSQISAGTILNCGTGSVTPTDVTFPVASSDFLEQYEGMLVRLPQTMYVTEHFQLGRFDQVVLSVNGKLKQPTNVVAPGVPALALQAQNDLSKIILDDASQAQNPDPIVFARGGLPLSASNTLRGGDTATGIIGVLNYTWAGQSSSPNAYRIRPINALNGSAFFEPTNPRPTSAPDVGGNVKVVGMNLLNFFNTFADSNANTPGCFPSGTDSDCRGANSAIEFNRQYQKTVAAILAMNPDVLGVNELENDGYGLDSSLQFLADQLNAVAGSGTYAFIDVDAKTGQTNAMGTDAIRVAMLYKPAVVTPVGQTAALNSVAFVNGGDSAPRSRPSLAQAFKLNSNGAVFIADINHLKSKGSACDTPDAGDGQGNCNEVRVNAANALMNWFATNPTGTGDPDILMLGDYNSYAMEDPIRAITDAGFTNLIESRLGPDAYSYVFDGQWGYLDYALGSATLDAQVTGVAEYHINSDEPSVLDYNTDFKTANLQNILYAPDEFRISDHDPVVVGLNLLNAAPVVTASFAAASISCGPNNATLNVSFSDADTTDTHHTALINWGDGHTQTVNPATSPFTLQHTYARAGTYTATVTVSDDNGGVGSATASTTVQFNTSGFLPPLNPDGANVFKYKSTIPVKISFTDCNGSRPANLEPIIKITLVPGTGFEINGIMRLTGNHYMYNLATKALPDSSGTYLITVTMPLTGQQVTINFVLRP